MEVFTSSLAELESFMPKLAALTADRRKIALYGDLGAGKTTLVQTFCRWLGVTGQAVSPTFSLVNEYEYLDAEGRPGLVYHLDLYRLKNFEEALDIGIEELLDSPWYCFIEWPQVIAPILPKDVLKIEIDILSETARRLLIL